MAFDFELDVCDLRSALRSTPMLRSRDVWDPLERTIAGSSFLRGDAGTILCIQDFEVLQPFRKKLMRRDYVTLQFTQSGAYSLHADGQIRQIRSGSVRLNAMAESISEFRQVMTMRGASIFVEREQLIEYFGLQPDLWREGYRTALSQQASMSVEVPLTPEMWLIVEALNKCCLSEPIRSRYLVAKATELLTLAVVQFNNLARPRTTAGLGRSAREQRLIEAAALVYRQELSDPPSIEALSRRLGLNRNKLTDGFQSALGMSPAAYSRKMRLDWAARRLSEGLDVSQAAVEVGYESAAAFSRAFKRQFGHAPSKQASNT